MSQTYCCEQFTRIASHYKAPVMGGLFPPSDRPKAQIEQAEDGSWNINGCCGGGCYVVMDILFCPYCGTKMPASKETSL